MTPLHLEFCLAFHWSPNPAEVLGVTYNSPAGEEVLQWMIDEGLIKWSHDDNRYERQERLGVFIEHLCQQPLPVQKWVTP